ncbi:MAG: hypothetical protein HUU38_31545 [Anaerolineales bacterium]|nr:hypothetical protein [Anaerolineales bacterium]
MGELSAYVLAFARFVIGFVFLWSAGSKLRDFAAFERAVADFQLSPAVFSRGVAFFFVSLELSVTCIMGWSIKFLRNGFIIAMFLLVVFSLALSWVLLRGIKTSCHCFGASKKLVSKWDLVRNVCLLGVASLGYFACNLAELALTIPELTLLAFISVAVVAVLTQFQNMSWWFQEM